ncbi:MAG: InlB B-repeat-containing protein, partial [Enterococcus sp.]|nr:InlB B-repeat-containing protein [Enterococcus sp.]
KMEYNFLDPKFVDVKYGDGFTEKAKTYTEHISWPVGSISALFDDFTHSRYNIDGLLNTNLVLSFLDMASPIFDFGIREKMEEPNNALLYGTIDKDVITTKGTTIKAGTPIYDPMTYLDIVLKEDITLTLTAGQRVHLIFEQGDGVEFSRLIQSLVNDQSIRLTEGGRINKDDLLRVLNECAFYDSEGSNAENYGLGGFLVGDSQTPISLNQLLNMTWFNSDDGKEITILSEKKDVPLNIKFEGADPLASLIDPSTLPEINDVYYGNSFSETDIKAIESIKVWEELAPVINYINFPADKDIFYIDQNTGDSVLVPAGQFLPRELADYAKFIEDITFYVPLDVSPDTRIVVFDSQGGSYVDPVVLKAGQKLDRPEDPVRVGYEFDGWYKDAECSEGNEWDFSKDVVTESMALYAKWKPARFDFCLVFFDENGGSGSMGPVLARTYHYFNAPNCYFDAPAGMEFDCWKIKETGQYVSSGEDFYIYDENVTLVAQWKEIERNYFLLSFDANGGSGHMDSVEVSKYTYIEVPRCDFKGPDSKRFARWMFTDMLYEYYVMPGESLYVSSDITLIAQWEDLEPSTEVYRLYNPNSGEHLYTIDREEKDVLASIGWVYELVAWKAPESGYAVYRYYNPNAGDHFYTKDVNEGHNLAVSGWIFEGVKFYSADETAMPIYRVYNPNAVVGSHLYTTSLEEYNALTRVGWIGEKIAFYGYY